MKSLSALTAVLLFAAPLLLHAGTPIRLNSQNPRLFEYRGKPLVLITATEHYGAVMNRPFRWEPYLDDLVDKRMTASRLFVLYRELQTAVNPYSTCKPETLDYVSPYPRTGPGDARDRLPKYDLDQWNPEFFARLHGFLSAAEKRGIIVEVTLLADHHKPEIWELNPQHPLNNINKTPTIQPEEYITLRHAKLWERQRAFVEKIVRECNRYDNVFYEICNEPQGNFPQQGGGSVLIDERQRAAAANQPTNPTHEEIDEWQRAVAKVIRDTEAALPNKHLISGQPAMFAQTPYEQYLSEGFAGDMLDIVNVHQMHRTSYAAKFYDLSMFMSRQLRLQNLRDVFVTSAAEKKPLNLDEDNAASRFTNLEGWTIHRKRAWTTVLNGGHYDMIDFTIQNRLETGTPEAQQHIRTWLKHLSAFVHSLDLVNARPMPQLVKQSPEHTIASVLGVEGKEYALYLADAREVTEPDLGDEIQSSIALKLPDGAWQVQCIDPASGKVTPLDTWRGGELTLPPFRHDIAVHLTAARQSSDAKATSRAFITPSVTAPRVQFHTFESTAAMASVSYHIYTLEIYDTEKERRVPVLYWLHGSGGGLAGIAPVSAWFDAAIREGKIPPMLVVFPNGLASSMWCDSKDGAVPMETIVIKELLLHLDATFRTVAKREGRIIEGFSMGGYGAARLGFKYPQLFGAVSILAGGPLDLDFAGPRATGNPTERERILKGTFGGDLDYYRSQNPITVVQQQADVVRGKVRVRMAVGARDNTGQQNRAYSEHLKELNIAHTFTIVPGVGHDTLALLRGLGENNWRFYREVFSLPKPPKNP